MNFTTKDSLFNCILSSVSKCDICPRMCERKKVLSELNGNLNSKVVFIAEAPGRLGAECTGIPLYGDATGNNFEMLLSNIGWSREDVFITNAILCNPQDENGNNSTPTKEEICNCSYYLEMVLELIQPDVIITLGVKALEALNNIEKHNYVLKDDVATLVPWHGTNLYPLYHMSPRAMIHRSMLQQRTDFIKLSHEVSPKSGLKKNKLKKNSNIDLSNQIKLNSMVEYIVYRMKVVSFFKLTKLLFLLDYEYLNLYGTTISNGIYLRMQEGPWIPYLKDIVKQNSNISTEYIHKKPFLYHKGNNLVFSLTNDEKKYIDTMIEKYKDYTDSQIKTRVYATKPMKYILRQEKSGKSMLKTPVLYKNITVDNANISSE